MSQLKVGIVGQGRSGRNIHALTLSKLPEMFHIAAVTDTSAERRKRAEEEFGCDSYADYRDLFKRKDIDLIVNATPSHMHVKLTREFLEKGFHVLCEKPLARNVSDVDILIETAAEKGKTLAVFQNSRYAPAYVHMRKIIDSGVLGRIVKISINHNKFSRRWDWQTLKANHGGNLLNTGTHQLDQALQFFNTDTVPEVTCFMDRTNSFGDAEDYVKIMLSEVERPLLDIEISSTSAYPGWNYHVQGTHGGISGTEKQLNWKYYRPEEAPEQKLVEEPLENSDGIPVYGKEKLMWYEDSWFLKGNMWEMMFSSYYIDFYHSLADRKPLQVTPIQIRQQAAVIEECFRQNPLYSSEEMRRNKKENTLHET
ncbi:Gfo/Idh/MocA family protein [Lentibacillus sediminis]|uniref:Gfo/Idh/MocA family protein n=1 Tax=Lentibacillus sediminis TaxID=1940529 RepID=UPI000C1B903A|nr:Gfo/Idh/MocA family oxidoreductase [Lentibacillus sediminis]